MIVADRRELENSTKKRALEIQREEMQVFQVNLQVLGTQSAFLAGLGWGALTCDFGRQGRLLEICLYVTGTSAVGLHVMVAFICAVTSMQGPELAVRGPDGSMCKALIGMYAERRQALKLYGCGLFLILTHGIFVICMRTGIHASLFGTVIYIIFIGLLFAKATQLSRTFYIPVEYRRVNSRQAAYQSSPHVGVNFESTARRSEPMLRNVSGHEARKSSSAPAPRSPVGVMTGVLRKRSGKLQNSWTLRYFSVNETAIQYFTMEGELKRTISLCGEEIALNTEVANQFGFSLIVGDTVVELEALNAEDYERWMDAFRFAPRRGRDPQSDGRST